MQEFEIPGRLPGMNELTKANRTHWSKGAQQKKKWTRIVAVAARRQVKPVSHPVRLEIHWIEPNARRDLDNVQAGLKFVMDGLVEAKIIPDDSRAWVNGFSHEFPEPDKKNPRVVVRLYPAG